MSRTKRVYRGVDLVGSPTSDPFKDLLPCALLKLVSQGLIERHEDTYRLTPKGLAVANSPISEGAKSS